MAINSTISGILRAYPVIMMYSTVLLYIMTSDLDFLYLLMMLFLGEGINHTLKYKVFKAYFWRSYSDLGSGFKTGRCKRLWYIFI